MIGESIHKHRIDSERASQPVLDRSVCEALAAKLSSPDLEDVKYALDVLSTQPLRSACVHLRALLTDLFLLEQAGRAAASPA